MTGSRTTLVRAALLVVGCAAAFALGAALRNSAGLGPVPAWAADAASTYEGPWAMAERVMVNSEEQGSVQLGSTKLLQIQTTASGLTGYERALIVAKRLNDSLSAGLRPDQVRSATVSGMPVVMAGNISLITVTSMEADRQHQTTQQLANSWAATIAGSLGGAAAPAPTTNTPVTPASTDTTGPAAVPATVTAADTWTPPEPYKDKLVPILSVLSGVEIGVARINGPSSKVDQTQGVAQLELKFKDALNINVYVPISTKTPSGAKLDRVQGVGVTGVADYRL
ncbi:MAG TPA: hypothetical protein VGM19_07230 [Armatimonadota bacterium]|jgi:hypothetical protein